jgi:hypothetical protein
LWQILHKHAMRKPSGQVPGKKHAARCTLMRNTAAARDAKMPKIDYF